MTLAEDPGSHRPMALVIDDRGRGRSLLRLQLEAKGWQVRTAAGLEQARQIAQSEPPVLVVTDLNLADDQRGLQTARAVVAAFPQADVHVVTADSGEPVLVQGLEAMGLPVHAPGEDWLPEAPSMARDSIVEALDSKIFTSTIWVLVSALVGLLWWEYLGTKQRLTQQEAVFHAFEVRYIEQVSAFREQLASLRAELGTLREQGRPSGRAY